uniref:Uncharacterized protein n=1 Tax=Hyaloperonospora arabidopsidis (strain Emoy2) TaxID=559515 RepID=M4BLK2_HYAAE
MAETTVTFENTMRMGDLDGDSVSFPPCAASVPIPMELSKGIEEELKTSAGQLSYPTPNPYALQSIPIHHRAAQETRLVVRTPMDHFRTPDAHDQTLRATHVRKIPETVSAAVAAAAVPEHTKQIAANTAVIRSCFIQHISVAALSSPLHVGPKDKPRGSTHARWTLQHCSVAYHTRLLILPRCREKPYEFLAIPSTAKPNW